MALMIADAVALPGGADAQSLAHDMIEVHGSPGRRCRPEQCSGGGACRANPAGEVLDQGARTDPAAAV